MNEIQKSLLIGMVIPAMYADASHPNILYIVADDLENIHLGCYGGAWPTPNIDRLAARGIRFTRFYAASTICTPARYNLLTGRYASRNQWLIDNDCPAGEPAFIRWNVKLDGSEKTIASYMPAEYHKTYIGKWHNGEPELFHVPYASVADDPEQQTVYEKNYRISCDFVMASSHFDEVRDPYVNNVEWLPLSKDLMGHHQHRLTYDAIEILRESKGKPFLIHLASTLPHWPRPYEALNLDERGTVRGYMDEHVNIQPSYNDLKRRIAGNEPIPDILPFETYSGETRDYYAGVIWLDDAIGRILDELDMQGLTDSTYIILVSDHSSWSKMTANLGTCPLIISGPGIQPAVSDTLVSGVDIVPTVAELAGGSLPDCTDGKSLMPVLRNETSEHRPSVFIEVTYTRGVATKEWKYIATRFPEHIRSNITSENRRQFNQEGLASSPGNPDGKMIARYSSDKKFPGYFDDDQLYDLRSDPDEQNNLADNPQYRQKLEEMKSILKSYCSELPHSFGEFK